MRMLMLMLAALGALAACLVLVIGAGAWRLKEIASTDPVTTRPAPVLSGNSVAAQAAPIAAPSAVVISAGPNGENLPEPPPPEGVLLLKAEQAKLVGNTLVLITPQPRNAQPDGAPRGEFRLFGLFADRQNRVARGNMFGKDNFEPFITRWTDDESAAQWTVTVPKAGKYAVQTSYSQLSRRRDSGNFIFSVGSSDFEHEVVVSGRIDEADIYEIGQVSLPAGETKVTVRPGDGGTRTSLFLRNVRLVHVD
jgi:hypothetical protein